MELRKLHGRRVYMAAKNWHLNASANGKATYAIKIGILVRPAVCGECGKPPAKYTKILGHHDDYAKPLEVRWVCRNCHMLIHHPHSLLPLRGKRLASDMLLENARAAELLETEAKERVA
jgi:hypothetical protein